MSPRTIVVTGAGSGIGKAIAERFATAGWSVAAAVRRPEEHAASFAAHPNLTLFPLDVTDQAQVDRFATAVHDAYPTLDVLVNNAGRLLMGPLETNTMAQIRAQYETNVFGLMMVTKAFIPLLRAQRSGTIVNIASASAKVNYPFLAAYGSSKWAVAGLSEALTIELAPFNIKVKTIFPGTHGTPIFSKIEDGLSSAGAAADAYRPYFDAFLALQSGITRVPAAGNVAEVVYRAVVAGDECTEYIVGRDAVLTLLLRRLLPQRAFKRALVTGILRPPSRLALRLAGLLLGGRERLVVDRAAFRKR